MFFGGFADTSSLNFCEAAETETTPPNIRIFALISSETFPERRIMFRNSVPTLPPHRNLAGIESS